ncbi:MAG TPA: transposase [Tepidisphaeraceae bacterium]|jgi:putative transposase|nr:transposase [Tepidisphaeraceae bacterium]
MPRLARVAPGGLVYHVLSRANGRLRLFRKESDFSAFYQGLLQARARHSIRILAWCIISNHWHFVVWPRKDGELSRFFGPN